ncbi:MAG: glucose 1-dehydrogenase [Chloroflexi bacterium]|nr:glucose 1-dehydrogenase [Chloroflexota bacterium]
MASHKTIIERFQLSERVSLVTGGGSGIGRGFAHALGEAGAKVAVVDINMRAAEAVAHELTVTGVDAIALTADVTQPDQVQMMADSVVNHWGSLTIGVNNAGIAGWFDAETMPAEEWRKIMAVNLDGVFYCAQAEARIMLAAGYGKIINTASMSAHISNAPQNQAAYNASKAGVLHLSRSLATEWAPRGVRVNSISPGYTRTALVEQFIKEPIGAVKYPFWMERTPMGHMAEVSDLVGALVYLASEASDFMTGHDLIIDGGYCAW